MVIFIDKSIGKKLENDRLNEDETFFFIELANAHRQGKCYLCGNLQSIEHLSQVLENPVAGIYRQILNHYAESGQVINLVGKVLVLTFIEDYQKSNLPDALIHDDKAEIALVGTAMQWNLQGQCCLLGEDLSDCGLYQCIGTHFIYKKHITNLRIALHCESGGGSGLGEGLEKCVSKDLIPTLCLVDSDQKFDVKNKDGTLSIGTTQKMVNDTSKKLKSISGLPPFDVISPEVHEVENLIPTCILLTVKRTDMEQGLALLEKLKDICDGRPALFYDLKKGFPYIARGPQREYWAYILSKLGGSESNMPPETKKEAEQHDNEHIVFPYVIERQTLDKSIKVLQDRIPKGELVIDSHLDAHWNAIGAVVLTWGCANMPTSA